MLRSTTSSSASRRCGISAGLWAAIKAGVASVMCAYNQINSAWACENSTLLNDILRGRLGFRGFVIGLGRSAWPMASRKMVGDAWKADRKPKQPAFTEALKAAVKAARFL
jgi:hypothetical protein